MSWTIYYSIDKYKTLRWWISWNFEVLKKINVKNQNDGILCQLSQLFCRGIIICANYLIFEIGVNLAIVALWSPSYKKIVNFINSLNKLYHHFLTSPLITNNEDAHSCEYLNLTASKGFLPAHLLPTRVTKLTDNYCNRIAYDYPFITLFIWSSSSAFNLKSWTVKIQVTSAKFTSTKLKLFAIFQVIEKTNFSSIYSFADASQATEHFLSIIFIYFFIYYCYGIDYEKQIKTLF